MSDTKKNVIGYIIYSFIIFLISLIYNQFSHNVYSIYMTYAFIIPLIGLSISLLSKNKIYHNFLAASILTLTNASILQGIITIAGTTTYYVNILIALSTLLFIMTLFNLKTQ